MESQEDSTHLIRARRGSAVLPRSAEREIPSPETAYCLAGSIAPENGCRRMGCRPWTAQRSRASRAPENGCRKTGFPVEIFSSRGPIFAQIPRTACATILLRGPRTESTVLSTNLWIIPCKSAPHRRNFYAQSSHHHSGSNPPAAPLPYPLERRSVRAQRRRFSADRPG